MKQYQKKQALETAIGGVFLLLGLVSVGCVLLICTYLVISGIPAIRKIGLVPFLFGKVWASTAKTNPQYGILPFILPSVYGTAGAIVLGVGRAIGEAMAVMMVSGNACNMPSLFESVRFLTTAVASEMSYSSGLQRQALFSIALVLFLFIMLLNATLNFFLKRNKEG